VDDQDRKLQPDPIPPSADAIARGHEGTTVSLRGIVYTMAALGAVCAITFVVAWYMMQGFGRSVSKHDVPPSPLASDVIAPPPQPWLQPSPPQGEPRQPAEEMAAYRQQQDLALNSYRVLDAAHGVVEIPIDRAMQILAAPSTQPATRANHGARGGVQ
jgi:hypothetical protein